MVKKVLLCFSICLQLLLVALLGVVVYNNHSKTEIISGLFDEEVLQVEERTIDHAVPYKKYITASGIVVPAGGYVMAYTSCKGQVKQILKRVGEQVEKGKIILSFDQTEAELEIAKCDAELQSARATLAYYKKEPSEHSLVVKQKEIQRLQELQSGQKQQAFILNNLLSSAAISPLEYKEKQAVIEQTEVKLDKVHAEYKELKKGITLIDEKVYQSEIALKEARLKLSVNKLTNTVLKAPASGRIISLNFNGDQHDKFAKKASVILAEKTPSMIKVFVNEYDAYKIIVDNSLRAVAVHPKNSNIVFPLEYVSFEPKLTCDHNGEKKLHLYFSFKNSEVPIYFEQSFNVYLETSYGQEYTIR